MDTEMPVLFQELEQLAQRLMELTAEPTINDIIKNEEESNA
jgi:hypothetical protein